MSSESFERKPTAGHCYGSHPMVQSQLPTAMVQIPFFICHQ